MDETAAPPGTTPSLYLRGHLAPVPDETEAFDLPVTGTLPPELAGRYLRNGPNPLPGEDRGHWFAGHGMLHGIRIRDGRAEWYRNRWVRTRLLDGAPGLRRDGSRDRAVNPANTHVIEQGGRLLALCEGGLPYQVTPELDTVGPEDFADRLGTAMTAHPKQDPVTGELHFFGYGVQPPYLTYHRLSAAGVLEESTVVDVPGATMMHDFAITEHYIVWLDLPVTFQCALAGAGMPFQWDDAYGARLGVMPRDGGGTRWFDIEPCYVFHVGNAREDGQGRVVLDAVRYDKAAWDRGWSLIGGTTHDAARGGSTAAKAAAAGVSRLYRWTLDPAAGTLRESGLDDRGIEFPTLNDARVGRPNHYLYAVAEDDLIAPASAVVKYDTGTGGSQAYDLGSDRVAGEAVFVPARDARAEDDGWLLSVVTDRSGSGSELLVLDATNVSGPPVASVRLPRRVPAGFHGSWISDDELGLTDGERE